ncbi:UDP-2-acetamido-2,6-beta-L-arabino-hexul-4-ose reductase [Pseudomonas sp. BIGb0408]|uniref:UDP-2-acetamido-2,6-beta-L-arabino-hexul-4-ose reductase n=1 Tax=Phytopseudomonas flavescens TaxID=29435 RepID=A0A7Y9XKZ2_9GAMM|nr:MULTISPECIES: capsular polysaccharide biosynthesis protein CapF [Pseudomonas]MCW2292127.1 UDP-2-acetamido-2,6-beta-L-arabino-hexul-4-ose reductase [Pseudomonas sp. BIGb0408]NYH73301.1 UDP-2-acetamido-2,6-beta-L-arabino-hexul-4-ose reductase [Pseudomonas flavescens]
MKVLITGANGFVGKNLIVHLKERQDVEILTFGRSDDLSTLGERIAQADFVFHLAGVNRPQDPAEFREGNTELTVELCKAIEASGRQIPVVYTSSSQASLDNPYGVSKRGAEEALHALAQQHGSAVHLLRLPNVFGKWAKPNYNSAVATFCHNIARDLPIQINDPAAVITLVYIDDVIAHFLALMSGETKGVDVEPQYRVSVGEIADRLRGFKESRNTLITDRVGEGFVRALYSTYLSYLPPERFTYEVPKYGDPRGVFVEMLKTPDSGQFSFFTAHPGITRGGHYHHTKTEKFLVIKGRARFGFRHIVSGELHELITEGDKPEIVETVPGWTHDITNVGDDEMIVMLWANEIFDRAHPDTYACQVKP